MRDFCGVIGVCRKRLWFRSPRQFGLTVLVFADDDHELLYASPAPWHGAASPRDATTPTGDASASEAFRFAAPT